jgi:hypothetical protein
MIEADHKFFIRLGVHLLMKKVFLIIPVLLSISCVSVMPKTGTPMELFARSVPTPVRRETESPENKAVRSAEEFIAQNGYTDATPDKAKIVDESIESYLSLDEMLTSRRNSLESKAFGVSHTGRGREKGWTVVFAYKDEKMRKENGRAVSMNEIFGNMRVEHKDFILDNIDKKLP